MTIKQVTLTLTIDELNNTFDDEDIKTVVSKIFDSGMEDIGSTGNIIYDTIIEHIVNLRSIDVENVRKRPPEGFEEIIAAGIASGSVKVGI